MLELKLIKESKIIDIPEVLKEDKQIVFYLSNINDERRFFVTFSVVDLLSSSIDSYKCYLPENIKTIQKCAHHDIYKNGKKPHSIVCLENRKSFLCFMEDEEFFFYVNTGDLSMKVYRLDDLLGLEFKYKRLISTVYECEADSNYFYLGAVNEAEKLHLYRVNKNLSEFVFLVELESNKYPPHVVRNIGSKLFLSHEFKYSRYRLKNSNRIVNNDELASIMEIAKARAGEKVISNMTYSKVNNKYDIECLPGEIMSIDLETLNIDKYKTCGGSPAHFEIDSEKKFLYTSSHNFLPLTNDVLYLEPGVIDKYGFVNNELIHKDSFSVPFGYRYTSHKVGEYNGQKYIVVFGEPNRLIVIDADTMKLMFYRDIGKSYLSDDYVRDLVQSNNDIFSHLAIGIVGNGRYICFLSQEKIHFLDMETKEVFYETDILARNEDFVLFTSHLDII